MSSRKKPLPSIGQTADVAAFIATGETGETGGSAVMPSGRPDARQDARHDGKMRVMTAALPSISTDADRDSMRAIREARRRRAEPEPRTVKTTIRLPESVAKRLRVIAIEEGVTMTSIVEDVLRAWVIGEYDG